MSVHLFTSNTCRLPSLIHTTIAALPLLQLLTPVADHDHQRVLKTLSVASALSQRSALAQHDVTTHIQQLMMTYDVVIAATQVHETIKCCNRLV
jgi:hypothetical protein